MNQKVCWKCKSMVDESAAFCNECGQDLSGRVRWYYRPAWIAALTLTVLGPFSIYLVWRSPVLSTAGRWLYTFLILFFTVLFFYYFYVRVEPLYRELLQIQATLQ